MKTDLLMPSTQNEDSSVQIRKERGGRSYADAPATEYAGTVAANCERHPFTPKMLQEATSDKYFYGCSHLVKNGAPQRLAF